MEIRYLARGPEGKEDPTTALERIGLLADACHNLPGAGCAPRRGDLDPFIGPWRSITTGEHAWMAGVLKSANLDTAWLDAAPLGPPAVTPAERPRPTWGGFRFPRSLREYAALDTSALRVLLVDAKELGWPTTGVPDDLLRHTAADGTHLLRAIRPGEMLFGPDRDGLATTGILRHAASRVLARPQPVACGQRDATARAGHVPVDARSPCHSSRLSSLYLPANARAIVSRISLATDSKTLDGHRADGKARFLTTLGITEPVPAWYAWQPVRCGGSLR
jgi:hypothetical protein